jgi:hypothetical protein
MDSMRRGVSASAIALLLLGAGCETIHPEQKPDPGETGFSYFLANGLQRYVYPPPMVERALVESFHTLGAQGIYRTEKDGVAKYCGQLFDGRGILVTVSDCEGDSIVRIWVDGWGDEPFSRLLIDHISIRLAAMAQPEDPRTSPRAYSDSALHRGQDVAGYRGAPLR